MLDFILGIVDLINPWVMLIIAIFCSAVGTTSLKFLGKKGEIKYLSGVIIGYVLFLFLITIVLQRIEMGIGYAVWSGLSTVLMCLSGVVFFKERMSTKKMISISLIIIGVVGLNLADIL